MSSHELEDLRQTIRFQEEEIEHLKERLQIEEYVATQ